MSGRSEKRIESKKRKAAAFLELIKIEQMSPGDKTSSSAMAPTASTGDEPDIKKPRVDGGSAQGTDDNKPQADTVLKDFAMELRQRQKAAMRPKVFLTLDELTQTHPMNENCPGVKEQPPLFMTDIQHLLLYALQSREGSYRPRWCRLLRVGKVDKVVVVVADSVSAEDFQRHTDSLPTLQYSQDISVEMVSPVVYGSTLREDLLNVPLSTSQMKKLDIQKDKLNKKRDETPGSYDKTCQSVTTSSQDNFDRTSLLLNTAQMMYEGFPMPVPVKSKMYHDFVYTGDSYAEVTSESPMFAIDCEMVQTKYSPMELARVSVVNEHLQCVYDTYVKPYNMVTNYVTRFSGVTKAILDPVKTRLGHVQKHLRHFLPSNAILVGQSLKGDLSSLKMFHPYVIDTSVIYNLTGNRRMKTGLKKLAAYFLGRSIQDSVDGHSSVEDATATMELVLLKLRTSVPFGDMVLCPPTMDNMMLPPDDNITQPPPCDVHNETTTGDTHNKTTTGDTHNETMTGDNHATEVTANCDNQTDESSDTNDFESESPTDGTKLENTTSASPQEMNKRRLFFQRKGNKFIQSFFDAVLQQHKSGKVIDEPGSRDLYPECKHPGLVLTSGSDKESERLTTAALADHSFTFTHLYGYRNHLRHRATRGEAEWGGGKVESVGGKAGPDGVEAGPSTVKAEPGTAEAGPVAVEAGPGTVKSEPDTVEAGLVGAEAGTGRQEADPGEEEVKKCLWKLDRRIWKIQKRVPPNSVFIVILPGRLDNQARSAMTFAKIT